MNSLLVLSALLGLGACGILEIMTEDAVVETSPFEPYEKMNISDTRRCPRRRIRNWHRFGNTCYKLFTSRRSFSRAELSCRRRIHGGHLASIHSSRVNLRLRQLFRRRITHAWVGGLHLQQGRSYIWTDGSDFNFQNWSPSEPNNRHGKEYCMEMYNKGRWNDLPCKSRQAFICEYCLKHGEDQEDQEEDSLETAE